MAEHRITLQAVHVRLDGALQQGEDSVSAVQVDSRHGAPTIKNMLSQMPSPFDDIDTIWVYFDRMESQDRRFDANEDSQKHSEV